MSGGDVTAADRHAWAEPGAYEVAPGVFRIPLPLPHDGLRAVNVYAIRDGERLVLVDGGWAIPAARTQLERALRDIGATVRDIARFVVTHVHRDHYTQAVALREEIGAHVALGIGERATLRVLQAPGAQGSRAQLDLLRRHGADDLVAELERTGFLNDIDPAEWRDPDEWLPAPHDLPLVERTLRVVATPGHTAGHVVFADLAAGLLFSGDHVLPHITPSIGFEPALVELPLRDYLDSLRLVRTMPDMVMLPAHGPVAPRTHARIDALIAHHDERLDAMLAAAGVAPVTAYEIAQRIGWTRRALPFAGLDGMNRMLAVCETGAHLDLLTVQGRLVGHDAGGRRSYRRP